MIFRLNFLNNWNNFCKSRENYIENQENISCFAKKITTCAKICILDFLFWRRCAPRSWEILGPFPFRGRMFALGGAVSPNHIPIGGLIWGCLPQSFRRHCVPLPHPHWGTYWRMLSLNSGGCVPLNSWRIMSKFPLGHSLEYIHH